MFLYICSQRITAEFSCPPCRLASGCRNCTGFLRINSGNLPALVGLDCDPLDDSRIHPEHYKLAKRIAASALQDDYDEEMAVGRAMDRPDLVEQLDLEKYNRHLMEEEGKPDSLSLLIDIQV